MTAPTTGTKADSPGPTSTRNRRRWVGVALLAALVLLGVVLVWFQPQALLFDTVVEEEFPAAVPAAEAADAEEQAAAPEPEPASDPETDGSEADVVGGDETTEDDEILEEDGAIADAETSVPVDEPVALATGSFDSRNRYTVTGAATGYELVDGTRVLRLEGFESTNGPDLFVYLTVADASEPSDAALAAEYVDLGVLRGNIGDQNYAIPPDVDLARFDTVVIWCRRFSSAFGAADLR